MQKVYDFAVQKEIFDAIVNSEPNCCKLISEQFGLWCCKGSLHGCSDAAIWGSNPYLKSEGNLLCTAARHAGLVGKEGGLFRRYDIGKVA